VTTKLKEFEKQIIINRLCEKEFNISCTAKSLGIGIRTLQRKLRSYGMGPQSTNSNLRRKELKHMMEVIQ